MPYPSTWKTHWAFPFALVIVLSWSLYLAGFPAASPRKAGPMSTYSQDVPSSTKSLVERGILPAYMFVGGRVGEPTCSPRLGAPKQSNCQKAIQVMESAPFSMRIMPIVTYLSTAALAHYEALNGGFPSSGPGSRGNFIEVPRVYSYRKIVGWGIHEDDTAMAYAIKQTALSIRLGCVGQAPDLSAAHATYGTGGWQIAGVAHNLNITVFSIPDIEYGMRPGLQAARGEVNRESTLLDPTYLNIINDPGEPARSSSTYGESWADSVLQSCSTGYTMNSAGSCCPGYILRLEPVTEANVQTWATVLGGPVQSLLNLGKIGFCGIPGSTLALR
ncbi:MAG: hypothetical protein M1827_004450 [Pycnora praestabilis]|nr:MAG: hypothetical protein M1827_004450 [Pycnora praestabilis]